MLNERVKIEYESKAKKRQDENKERDVNQKYNIVSQDELKKRMADAADSYIRQCEEDEEERRRQEAEEARIQEEEQRRREQEQEDYTQSVLDNIEAEIEYRNEVQADEEIDELIAMFYDSL